MALLFRFFCGFRCGVNPREVSVPFILQETRDMAQVCNWLSIFACMRGTSSKSRIQHQIHPGRPGHFDAVIVWKGKETQKANTGGVAYEVILKPAAADVPRPSSPPKDKGITHDDIVKKLQEAEERRLSMEAAKLESVAKGKERAQQAHVKVQEEVENKTRVTQEKIRRSMEVNKENREAQIQALQGRLRDHLLKVEETCKKSEQMTKELEERIKENLGKKEEKRNAQKEAIRQKMKEHSQHVEEVLKASENLMKDKASEEKIIEKLQRALRNRNEQLQNAQKKYKEHEKKIEEVRKNKSQLKNEDENGEEEGEGSNE